MRYPSLGILLEFANKGIWISNVYVKMSEWTFVRREKFRVDITFFEACITLNAFFPNFGVY